ncbi:TetR/AcrR family transcriptional regulator [Secundilactobacillus collinoides]|uniref:TetR/AcrR family transcriptional regulator n=1 Tax=Secundilactobacillus collinoides TaxID=33960 RepID=UPI0006CFAF69|nr:TetR/AcrR family transcriptional regulator [Secundilactobacillus collinoides]
METKNDRRSRKTQKLIFDTFTGLLQKKDFAKISIKDITDQADVNRSTFYIHFEDKYDLLNKYLAFQTLDFSSYAVQIHANIPQKKNPRINDTYFFVF